MNFERTQQFAQNKDQQDPLRSFRDEFYFPEPGKDKVVYFAGNSLGLQPKKARAELEQELEDWKNIAVKGHVQAERPWVSYESDFQEPLADITGAKPDEVVAMNTLTVNLHLLTVSFYQPDEQRNKILIDGKTFPSDRYAMHSQAQFYGFDPLEKVVEVMPSGEGEPVTSRAILEAMEKHKDKLKLVMISAVHYYTGEYFDIEAIAHKARENDIFLGLDLAHAIGNVPLSLHEWGVDFAVWCSYKYLNGGPGAIGGAFVHEKHHSKDGIFRLAGWWGHNPETRFDMPHRFDPQPDIRGWQLSNVPIFSLAPQRASLQSFTRAGMEAIRSKSLELTDYLAFVIREIGEKYNLPFKIITPLEHKYRGAQLSLEAGPEGKSLYDKLVENDVVLDWRSPSVIRMAPAPLYNSFEDVYRFGEILEKAVREVYEG